MTILLTTTKKEESNFHQYFHIKGTTFQIEGWEPSVF